MSDVWADAISDDDGRGRRSYRRRLRSGCFWWVPWVIFGVVVYVILFFGLKYLKEHNPEVKPKSTEMTTPGVTFRKK